MISTLIKPLLTEKMTSMTSLRQYAFSVNINSNKIEIAKAVEKKFNVEVLSVRTVNVKGKLKGQMTKKGRVEGRRPSWKKAFVTIKEGQTIDLLPTA
ncbi:MAG: 50S ribosomal protein L23 [Bacteroidetes bacterium]|nr:50S ribosomal protein L23 [Bacteroidota bacterium]